ncbi:MAG: TerD family protein [Opitutaceae bacterium]|nr:TerD family protein [Cytophagales bacterium]
MINLKKGNSISLEKDGKKLENVYVGLNWGKIKTFFGLMHENVDLDGSVSTFDYYGEEVDTVYYAKKESDDRSIKHSGDDVSGDSSNDNKDNETISINLAKVSPKVKSIVVFLNSYRGQDFDSIPYANIRLLEGDAVRTRNAFANFNLSSDPKFKDKVSMVMARIDKTEKGWNFVTIGEPVETKKLGETIDLIKQRYLG